MEKDAKDEGPVVTTQHNGRVGAGLDLQTNTVGEPLPGVLWTWEDTNCVEEWLPRELQPGQQVNVWYQAYVWTPPPWSNNANKNSPRHEARANWVRVILWAYPVPGEGVR